MRRSVFHLTELQFATGHNHPVSEDSYYPADLCDICTDVVKAALGDALKMGEKLEPPEMELRGFDMVMPAHPAHWPGPPSMEARERDEAPRPPAEPVPRPEL
jgi:hypothetical protein